MTGFGTNPLDRWEVSIEAGNAGENKVARILTDRLGWVVQRNNLEDPKAEDLLITIPATCATFTLDVKWLSSPYPSSPTPARLHAAEHLTLDVSNVEKYPPGTVIMCVVDYTQAGEKAQPTKGVFCITAGRVQTIMAHQPYRMYSRSQRTMKDKVRKVAVSIKECKVLCIDGLTQEQTADIFIETFQ